ncbi:MAG: SUMF1/EgtB/PvdO family nonheme iron enzyme [Treponema sp.]|nr:SUMF1/EgtB/PvdO family nonheme iron enzyme [Treponema sp.]
MPKSKKPRQETSAPVTDEDIVRLPSFLGIRPGVYLAVIYGFVILLVLFLLTVYPGLSKPGTVFAVNTEPSGAAVRIDGIYNGVSPCNIFVPRGNHKLESVMPGFTDYSKDITAGSSVFLTLFFPKKEPLFIELNSSNPNEAFKNAASEYAAWSFYGESTAASQVPMVLSEAAYRLAKYSGDSLVKSGINETMTGAVRFAVTRLGLRDLLRAKFLTDNRGQSPSPAAVLGTLDDMIDFLDKNPQAASWLADLLPPESAPTVKASDWYKNSASGIEAPEQTVITGPDVTAFGGLRFREIMVSAANDGAARRTAANNSQTQDNIFFIAETPVTPDLWNQFLDENPQWRAENKDSLVKDGLVNSQYLSYASYPGLPANTQAWVSWYAAKAWCQWYNTKIRGIPGTVRLPVESEWLAAAGTGLEKAGEFWDWCENPYVPLDFFPAPDTAFDPGSPQRPVRGGSWINYNYLADLDSRGSLPPDSCSPFVSFRPVISVFNPDYTPEARVFQ